MLYTFDPFNKKHAPSFEQLFQPVKKDLIGMQPLYTRGNRPLQMNFEDHLKALVFFHLEAIGSFAQGIPKKLGSVKYKKFTTLIHYYVPGVLEL